VRLGAAVAGIEPKTHGARVRFKRYLPDRVLSLEELTIVQSTSHGASLKEVLNSHQAPVSRIRSVVDSLVEARILDYGRVAQERVLKPELISHWFDGRSHDQ
jgi:hypothetical protein